MKRLLIMLVMVFAGATLFGVASFAEEVVEPIVIEEVVVEDFSFETATEFFNSKILPLVIGGGSAFIGGLALLVPYLKNNGRYKALQGLYTGIVAEKDKLATLLDNNSLSALNGVITQAVNDTVGKLKADLISQITSDKSLAAKALATSELILAQVDTLINAARIAWKEAEGATNILTTSPTEFSVAKLALKLQYLTQMHMEQYNLSSAEIEAQLTAKVNASQIMEV